jgi:dihydrodipicolinate synthase/N-acetylneuraminate lyase
VLSGDDNLTLPLMVLGGDGVISVASNIVPRQVSEMVQCALQGKWDEARVTTISYYPFLKHFLLRPIHPHKNCAGDARNGKEKAFAPRFARWTPKQRKTQSGFG